MPEPPASSHLLEGKRGVGGGGREGSRGGPGIAATGPSTTVAVVSSINNITSNSSLESSSRERDRGGGGIGDRRRDDLTTPIHYSAADVGTVSTTAPCDVGRSSGGGVPFIPGGTPSGSSGGFSQEQQQQGSGASDPFPTIGMDVTRMQQQLSEYTDSLFLEGLLDDQFTQLQLLQDENNPEFVAEVVSLFFDDSEKLLEQLSESLETDPIDYKKVDAHVHQFKGSSSSIGAQRVKTACITFRACCDEENKEGCRLALAQVKQEFYLVKSKLEAMLALEQRLLAAGGTLPFME